jgi:3-methyladenine DNA glycosylase Tag
MRSLESIYEETLARKPDLDARLKEPEKPKTPGVLAKIPNDRWLSQMTKNIFNAGFNWKVVDKKWPGFEEAFHKFDLGRCAMMHDEDFDRLISEKAIVRHPTKIRAVQANAVFVSELAKEHGSVGKAIGSWPKDDYVGLLLMLKKRGSRLGGNTGPYFLRFMGVDSYILSRDVSKRLIAEGISIGATPSQKSLREIQEAFNGWHQETGRPLTEISRILAMSVD